MIEITKQNNVFLSILYLIKDESKRNVHKILEIQYFTHLNNKLVRLEYNESKFSNRPPISK